VGWAVGQGIIRTIDGGSNWLNQSNISTLYSIHFIDHEIGWAVGTFGTILKTTNGGVTFIEDENNITQPKDFLLEQNYPNPFNPSTKISYQLPNAGNVTLKVFDVLGREVATLVDEYKNAGRFEVEFNANNLPSGVYFYQLKAGEFVETKKMILLK
jgi:hypothetical protein